MTTLEEAVTRVVEAYNARFGQWVPLSEIAATTGLTDAELTEAVVELLDIPGFHAEPDPLAHRFTAGACEYAVVIGGEARHFICFD